MPTFRRPTRISRNWWPLTGTVRTHRTISSQRAVLDIASKPMKVVIINKSDSTGGAAVVSRRLMDALRARGVDAQMLVAEKRHESPYVHLAASPSAIRRSFLAERLKIFLANGLNKQDLFKVDTASDGLPLHRHKLVRQADIICLNWVNQGMLSLKGLREILKLGKPVVWTMHDMWCLTGICHHAGTCTRWQTNCGLCKFLGRNARPDDISFSVWNNKKSVYGRFENLHFVAVSNWLADLARGSGLMADAPLSVIPNAFPIPTDEELRLATSRHSGEGKFRVVMGAARLDDPVKGFPILVEATRFARAVSRGCGRHGAGNVRQFQESGFSGGDSNCSPALGRDNRREEYPRHISARGRGCVVITLRDLARDFGRRPGIRLCASKLL